MNQEEILNKFIKWCDKNIITFDDNKRIGIEQFDKLINDAKTETNRLTEGQMDETSFLCGIAVGQATMTLPENEKSDK